MRVSAKADYAIRAAVELAAAGDGPVKGERLAQAQEIPSNFLENILSDLSLADVIRAVDGPLANVRGVRSEQVAYHGSAEKLRDVWVAVRASLRSVLENVTLADLANGELPASVRTLVADPDAWAPH